MFVIVVSAATRCSFDRMMSRAVQMRLAYLRLFHETVEFF